MRALVVSYGSPAPLERMLASLPSGFDRVHVWDNAGPASAATRVLAARHPNVDWTFSPTNIGFAAAVNRLMEATDGDVLLVNPDAVLSGQLDGLRQRLGEADVGAVAPVWRSTGRQPWDNCRRFPTTFRVLVDHAGLAPKVRRSPLQNRGPLYATEPTTVDWATGACLALSRTAWQDVGPFDERFWLYGEEVDWCLRAARRGWRVRRVDDLSFTHAAMGTVPAPADRARSRQLLRQSQQRLLTKHRGPLSASLFRTAAAGWDRLPTAARTRS